MDESEKGIYTHYKGKMYEVIEVVIHSETLEELVLYKPLYDTKDNYNGKSWVRPKDMFFDKVRISENKTVPRFQKIDQ
jgi:hypothetical protein